MEPPHSTYNQAGPSNIPVPFTQDTRLPPHYGVGRGRGHAGHRHANPNFHQMQQQPFFAQGVPSSYAGYSMGMNGVSGPPVHGQYGHPQNGVPPTRRPGQNYHAGNFQAPASPALHPTHMYNPHATPFIPPAAVTSPGPIYPYPHPPAHLQPYPTPFPPPVHHPPHSYANHPNLKSALVSPLSDQDMNLLRSVKALRPPSPLQVRSPSLPRDHQEAPSPPTASKPPTPPPLIVDNSSQAADHPPSSSLLKLASPAAETQSSFSTQSPSSPQMTLPSFDNQPAPQQEWVISASRPDDPATAFGIMISPKAKPPDHIVKGAREYIASARPKAPDVQPAPVELPDSKEEASTESREELSVGAIAPQAEQVSCSTTETESRSSTVPDTFVAGSPLSTATSVSIAPAKVDSLSEKENVLDSESTEPSVANESPKATASTLVPSSAPNESSVPSTSTKKSWASLLRSETSSSSKTNLPTSSVQGFSIPASSVGAPSSPPVSSEPAGKRAELLRFLNNGPSTSTGIPQIRPRGLVNTGNMCFANAVLQTLVYTPPFFRFFTELGKYSNGTGSNPTKWAGKDTPLVNATVEFLKEFRPKVRDTSKNSYEDDEDYSAIDSFIPSYFYDAMKEKSRFENMGGGQQEDAEEFFGFFLDTIEDELLAISNSLKEGSQAKSSAQAHNATQRDDWTEVGKKNKPIIARSTKSVDSPMARIFGGKFRSTLRVPGQKDSVIVEDWRSLKLDIQREQVASIEDALRYISHPQPVQVSSVTKGGAVVEASQQVLVDSLPPILVLHLKRFLYDTTARDVMKVHKQVLYGPELEVPSEAISPARRTAPPAKYKLFAVLYHHGSSAAGGHYTLDVLHPNRNADPSAKPREGWIRIDDELVTDMRAEDVFGRDRDCAYLLFYRRIAESYARAGQV